MDNIMKRFKCFNNIMQNNSSTDEDDKEDEVDLNEPEGEEKTDSQANPQQEEAKIEVDLPQME